MSLQDMKGSEIEKLVRDISDVYLSAVSGTYQTLTDQWARLSTPLLQQRTEALLAFEQDFRRMADLTQRFADIARNAGNSVTADVAQMMSDHFGRKANALLDPVVTTSQKVNALTSDWARSASALSREVRTFGEGFVRRLGPIADLASSADAWVDS